MPAVLSKGLHFLTSGFLITVVVFAVLAGIVFLAGNNKIDDVIDLRDDNRNNPDRLRTAFDQSRIAYILAFIAAGLSLLLMILYAGQERLWTIHQGFHAAIFVITYALIIISAIYAFLAVNELNHPDIEMKNSADAYMWVGLLLLLFAFIGLTGTGSGQLSMTSIRQEVEDRTVKVEHNINEHLPIVRQKVDEIHAATSQRLPIQMPTSHPSLKPKETVSTTTLRKFQ